MELKKIDLEWKDFVDEACTKNKNLFISNDAVEHSIYISKLLIERADKEKPIKIFTGELEEIFYNHATIRDAFEEAIKRNVPISIVVEKSTSIENYDFLKFVKQNDIKIKGLKKTKEELGIKDWGHFFLVGHAFRFEKHHIPEDFKEESYNVEGIANFNNPKIGESIARAFDFLTRHSGEI